MSFCMFAIIVDRFLCLIKDTIYPPSSSSSSSNSHSSIVVTDSSNYSTSSKSARSANYRYSSSDKSTDSIISIDMMPEDAKVILPAIKVSIAFILLYFFIEDFIVIYIF